MHHPTEGKDIMTTTESATSSRPVYTNIGKALGTDYFLLKAGLTAEEMDYLERTRRYVDEEVLPVINDWWQRAEVPFDLYRRLGPLGLVGDGLEGYGCAPMSPTAAGLITMELSRGDGSVATFLGVTCGLAMRSIHMHGSEEQKQKWLPAMAQCEKLGAFALTEPKHGSDSVGLETSAKREGDHYVINGAKRWIGNGTAADVVVVWARDVEDKQVKGFLVEKGTPGYDARPIENKAALRALWQADIDMTNMRIPVENKLPGANTFADTGKVLKATRASCAWAGLGHAVAGYDAALNYATQRIQFGRPLAKSQIVQEKLVKMLCEITAMQLYCMRFGQLDASQEMSDTIAALGKLNNTTKAREVLWEARNMLGGNGILLDNHVIRHMCDIEAIYTYEGTETIQTLLVGRDITGMGAFV
jgi:glutaryl-CoA dehydrogenase